MGAQRDWHLSGKHPKRILSLDGGGVRGLITLGMLKQVETVLRARSPDKKAFRLCDYFDLIGGTSTGALIGTMLAMGLSVERITEIYFGMIPHIFDNPALTRGYNAKFEAVKFEQALDQTFDEILTRDLGRADLLSDGNPLNEPRLCSDVLKTGLVVVAKRIDTNSVWVINNNPASKYWTMENDFWLQKPVGKRETFIGNKDYSLRKIVRASASAPYYLDGVDIDIDAHTSGLFVDGGVTPYNNPSAELLLHTTLRSHGEDIASPTGFGWETGADKLFMLSLGTGQWPVRIDGEDYRKTPSAWQAMTALTGMIADGEQAALTWMQSLSEPAMPGYIDGNLGTLAGLRIVKEPLLTFQRVNPVLEMGWLMDNLGFHYDIDPGAIELLRGMDVSTLTNLNRCYEVGLETGREMIKPETFPACFDHKQAVTA